MRSVPLLILLVAFVSSCTSFKTSPLSPQQAVEGRVWARLTVVEPPVVNDSGLAETVTLKNPWASDDAIGGEVCTKNSTSPLAYLLFDWIWSPEYRCAGSRAVALASIRGVETRRFDALKTSLLAGGIVGTIGLLLVIYAGGS